MKSLSIAIISLWITHSAIAGNYTCKNGAAERQITVTSTDATKKVPCEVKYKKEGEAEEKALWSAQADPDYCDTKAKEFSEKLTSLGFTCEEAKGTEAKAEPAAAAPSDEKK